MRSALRPFIVLISLLSTLPVAIAAATPAEARAFRVNDIPNGTKNTCLNCHVDLNASAQSDFGADAQLALVGAGLPSTKHVDWAKLCPFDSDRDGWTNGEELGDPDCKWQSGDMNPPATVFLPGEKESHPPAVCGDGRRTQGEECEGDMLGKPSCSDLAAGDGLLACTAECTYDYSACSAPPDGTQPPDTTTPIDEEGGCSAGSRGGASAGGGGASTLAFLALACASLRRRRANRERATR